MVSFLVPIKVYLGQAPGANQKERVNHTQSERGGCKIRVRLQFVCIAV